MENRTAEIPFGYPSPPLSAAMLHQFLHPSVELVTQVGRLDPAQTNIVIG